MMRRKEFFSYYKHYEKVLLARQMILKRGFANLRGIALHLKKSYTEYTQNIVNNVNEDAFEK